jgi:hypothetical protein
MASGRQDVSHWVRSSHPPRPPPDTPLLTIFCVANYSTLRLCDIIGCHSCDAEGSHLLRCDAVSLGQVDTDVSEDRDAFIFRFKLLLGLLEPAIEGAVSGYVLWYLNWLNKHTKRKCLYRR